AAVFAGSERPRERMARWLYGQQLEVSSAHVVEQGCELLGAAVCEKLRPARVALPMDEMDERWASEAVGDERFCLISAGGGWGAKIWPAERFGRVAAELGRASVRTVVNSSPAGLREAERPVVGIYGPTDPVRNGPYGTRSRVLRDASSATSYKRVSEVEEGMLRIGVEDVVAA